MIHRASTLLDILPEPACLIDGHGRILHGNPALETFTACCGTRLAGHPLAQMLEPAERDALSALLARADAEGSASAELRLLDSQGRSHPHRVWIGHLPTDDLADPATRANPTPTDSASAAITEAATPQRLCIAHNTAAQHQASEQLQLYRQVFEQIDEAVLISDADHHILASNPAFEQLSGYRESELRGLHPAFFSANRRQPEEEQRFWQTREEQNQGAAEWSHRHKDGRILRNQVNTRSVRDAAGRTTHHVTRYRAAVPPAEPGLSAAVHAGHDPVTGLVSQQLLAGRLEQLLAHARRKRSEVLLFCVDVEDFKAINRLHGHAAGDAVLIEITRRLIANSRESDIVARLDADRFLAVFGGEPPLENSASIGSTMATYLRLEGRLRKSLARPFRLEGHLHPLLATLGIARFPQDGDSSAILLRHAELALHSARQQQRPSAFFDPALDHAATQTLAQGEMLRAALAHSGTRPTTDLAPRLPLHLHYQPLFAAHQEQASGLEALLRWPAAPESGFRLHLAPSELRLPAAFLPLASECGLDLAVDAWVLDSACAQLTLWRQSPAWPALRITLNLSPGQVAHPELTQALERIVEQTLERHGIEAHALEFELPAASLLAAPAQTRALFGALHALGVGLALDHFGSTPCPLSALQTLPLDRIKLDPLLLHDLEAEAHHAALCEANIALAHKLGLAVVAVGIETPAQLQRLTAMGCDLLQGNALCPPLPADLLAERLAQPHPNQNPNPHGEKTSLPPGCSDPDPDPA